MKKFPYTPVSIPLPGLTDIPQDIQEPQISNINKNKRRSKNDQEGRSYKCGCGRMYLSYPALYTHIKTKHQGINPEGTNAPQFKNGRGRGRPRKLKDTTDPIKQQKTHPSDNIRRNPNFADQVSYLREIGQYSQQGTSLQSNFPQLYVGNQLVQHPLFQLILQQKQRYDMARRGEFIRDSDSKCQNILAKFLYQHSKVSTTQFFKTTTIFVCLLYKFLNQEMQQNYCQIRTCEEVPAAIGGFQGYLQFLGCNFDEAKVRSLVRHFCEWLYAHGFTLMKIDQQMESERIIQRLQNREDQLRAMAVQLAQQVQEMHSKDWKIKKLRQKVSMLEKRIKRKESQIKQELQDKGILVDRLSVLEKIVEAPSNPKQQFQEYSESVNRSERSNSAVSRESSQYKC